jgi:hypothetical protein
MTADKTPIYGMKRTNEVLFLYINNERESERMKTADYLAQLVKDKSDLINSLNSKGIKGLTGKETFTEIIPELNNIPQDIYKVASLEERDNLKPNEGDICLVYDLKDGSVTKNSSFKSFKFNNNFTIDTIEDSDAYYHTVFGYSITTDDSYELVMVEFGLNSSLYGIAVSCYTKDSQGTCTIKYTSSDGSNYTIESIEGDLINGDTVTLPYVVSFADEGNTFYEDCVTAITIPTPVFQGVFQYYNNCWNYLDIGLFLDTDKVLKDNTIYTSAGFITGSLEA